MAQYKQYMAWNQKKNHSDIPIAYEFVKIIQMIYFFILNNKNNLKIIKKYF